MAKEQIIDLITGEEFIFTDQASVEANTVTQRLTALAMAGGAALTLCLAGGAGVPSPRSEAVTIAIERDGAGDGSKKGPFVPHQRRPKLFNHKYAQH